MRRPVGRRRGVVGARLGEESGSILVVSAVLIPVMLVLVAFVVDVGNWYTHKRQLQNRADAGALAAGVDFASSWAGCVQDEDPALKAATEAVIMASARTYAGDPTSAAPVNTEIAHQARVEVLLNSTTYDTGSDGSDGGGPCFDHAGDAISPGGGEWVDVKVVERDLPSLFGGIGVPLPRNLARARVEIHPAISDNGFIPLAIPETDIAKAQLRYYDECTSPRTLLATVDLKPLKAPYQTVTGTVLWGPDTGQPEVDPSGIALTVPPPTDCVGGEYVPIGAEVRVAGRDGVSLNGSCDDVAALRFADCWQRLAEIRAWKDDPESTPYFTRVELTGAGGADGCTPDAYFARTPVYCRFNVLVEVDWQDRDDGNKDVHSNFSLTVNGTSLRFESQTPNNLPESKEIWVSNGTIDLTTTGGTPALLSWSWRDTDTSHSWGGQQCRNGGQNPCRGSAGNIPVHRLFLATDANAGVVDVVRTSVALQGPGSSPGLPLHGIDAEAAIGMPITVYPTVGLRSKLTAGQFRVLRAAGPQGNQSVDCEPTGGQGHDFQMFLDGCDPYYGYNEFDTGVWWTNQTPDDCPSKTTIFNQPNSPMEPWLCVPAAPGFSASVIADGIAARTGNCDQIQNNSCSRTACNFPSRYPATPDPTWAADPDDPRVVNLFVVPYGAFKGVNAQDGLPITNFPRFYVTGWGGNGSNRDPCPDDDPAQAGEIVGYFIQYGEPGGPVDQSRSCIPGSLRPCRALLVR